jgi:hypothetical protein
VLNGVEVSEAEVSRVFKVYFAQFVSSGRNVKEVFGSGLYLQWRLKNSYTSALQWLEEFRHLAFSVDPR